ncbi:MAG: hypothetical protein U0736_24425, partial [Gemmataceae bacterium]
TGLAVQNVNYRDVGTILSVIPKISPDGKVTMRVTPQISNLSATTLPVGNGAQAPIINQQILDTTIVARDGETVAIGGLITRSDTKTENKIPWLGDLPMVGTLFRYRSQIKEKRELLIILTPHIVRTPLEADKVLAEEARRMDWVLGDVIKTHGMSGMHPLFPPPPAPPSGGVDAELPAPVAPGLPGEVKPAAPMLPAPTPVPGMAAPLPPGAALPGQASPAGPAIGNPPVPVPPPAGDPASQEPMLPAPRPLSALPATNGAITPVSAVSTPEERPLANLSLRMGRPPANVPVRTIGGTSPTSTSPPATTAPEAQGKESDQWRRKSLFR